jgi:hypothetical protein
MKTVSVLLAFLFLVTVLTAPAPQATGQQSPVVTPTNRPTPGPYLTETPLPAATATIASPLATPPMKPLVKHRMIYLPMLRK